MRKCDTVSHHIQNTSLSVVNYPVLTSRSKISIAEWLFNVMDTINSILRSNIGNNYLLYIYESINKAMNIKARDSESIKKVIVLSSITNSYVEGTASSIDVCGQTVSNNLKEQDPERVLKYNEEILKKMREMGALKNLSSLPWTGTI